VDEVLNKPIIELATRDLITVTKQRKVLDAIRLMVKHDIRRLPIVDDRGRILGIITLLDILSAVYEWAREGEVEGAPGAIYGEVFNSEVMRYAKTNIVASYPHEPVSEVIEKLVKHNIGSMPIVDEEGRILGIFTEWDVVKLITSMDLPHTVSDVMTRIVYVLTEYSTVFDALEGIVLYNFRRYPILDSRGNLVAMLHAKDILRYLADANVVERLKQKGLEVLAVKAAEIAKSPLVTAEPRESVVSAARKMVENDTGGLPVVEGGRIIGLVTEKTLMSILT